MTQKEILQVAMKQSAEDIGCKTEDFIKKENVVVPLKLGTDAKKYYELPIGCNFISYGSNIVVGASEDMLKVVKEYVSLYEFYHCFETPNMYWLNEKINPMGQGVCFMAEYYLPDMSRLSNIPCDFELRVLEKEDFEELYLPQWSNALCKDRKLLDVLGVGAYEKGKLVGLSGCSADAKDMWQIGVDVLPEYRRKGIAKSITSRLAYEILEREKIPFYCTAWSNIRSARNAMKSGFLPAWAEMTVKPKKVIDDMNQNLK